MEVELLVVPECPVADEASSMLRTALDDIGLTKTRFSVQVINSDEMAQLRNFAGSPAFLVDGVDLFASDGDAGSMACRLYATPEGLQGIPALGDLRKALKEQAARKAGT